MNSLFRSLILIPSIFLIVLLGALSDATPYESFNIEAYAILLVANIENIFTWNYSIKNKTFTDFRSFFSQQYTRILYTVLIFALYVLSVLIWEQIYWWILFYYLFNYLVFRIILSSGFKEIENFVPTKSKPLNISSNEWTNNKAKLKNILFELEDELLKEEILDKLEFSSFVRTEKAKELIKKIEDSSSSERTINLQKFLKLM